jgi:hypothetical protein
MYFKDPFKNTPVDKIAEMTDKFTRNEVASSNEMRSVIGWKPVDDPRADELRNKNLNQQADSMGMTPMSTEEEYPDEQTYANGDESGGAEKPIREKTNSILNMKLSEAFSLIK